MKEAPFFIECRWCPGHYALRTISPSVSPVHPIRGHQYVYHKWGDRRCPCVVNLHRHSEEKAGFHPGFISSKVYIFFSLYTWRKWPNLHNEFTKIWHQVQSNWSSFNCPFQVLVSFWGPKVQCLSNLWVSFPMWLWEGRESYFDLTRQMQLNFHLIQSRERIALGMRLVWNKGSWS